MLDFKGRLKCLLVVVTSLVSLFYCIYIYWFKRPIVVGKQTSTPQVRGALPIIGHMHLIGGRRLLHDVLGAMADEYGPTFTFRLGSVGCLVVSDWEMAKECLTTHDRVFSTRPRTMASKLLGYDYAMLGFAPSGPYWQEMRKIAITELLSNHRIEALKHIRAKEVGIAVGELQQGSTAVLVDMKKWFGDLTGNIALKLVGGKRYYGKNADCGEEEAERFKRVMGKFLELLGTFVLSDVIWCLKWLDIQGCGKVMKKTAKELDDIVGGWLEEHKQKRMQSETDQDLMDVMLNVLENAKVSRLGPSTDTINKATCLNMILAISASTTVPLIWALSLLLNHPDALKKVQEEIDIHVGKDRPMEESDITNLVFLQAVVKETLRLYPPTPVNILREAMEDVTLSTGYHVLAGTRLFINTRRIQRDERVWPDGDQFRPERFLTSHKDVDLRSQNFELLPFSAGRRSCPGTSLALQMLHFILASFFHSFDVALPSDIQKVDMTEINGLANFKATPLDVVLTPRLSSELYGA